MVDNGIQIHQDVINQLNNKLALFERCGFVYGNNHYYTEIAEVGNCSRTPECAFRMKPIEQFEALREIKEKGFKNIIIFHTHPGKRSNSELSDGDTRIFRDKEIHAVYSIKGLKLYKGIRRNFVMKIREIGFSVVGGTI